MSLEIKTGYMTAADLDELNKGNGGITVPKTNTTTVSSDTSSSTMPKLTTADLDRIANMEPTKFTISRVDADGNTLANPKPIVNQFTGSDVQSVLNDNRINENREPTNMTTASDSGVNQILNNYRVNKKRFLQETINLASMNDADQAAQIQLLSKEFGIAPSIVQSNLDELKRKSELMKIDFTTLQADSPILAQQLQDITFSSVAHDDLEPLGAIEGAFKYFKDGVVDAFAGPKNVPTNFEAGRAGTDYGQLGFNIMANGGVFTEADNAEVKRLEEIMSQKTSDSWLGDAGYVAGSFYEPLRDAGIMSTGTALTVAGGTYLATLPYQGPFAFTPGPEDVLAGGGAAITGMAAAGPTFFTSLAGSSFQIEAGHSYLELRQMGATHENASNIAFVVGTTNAALEMVGIKAVTAPWRKSWQYFVQKKITNAMTRKGLVADVLGTYLAGIGVETGTEVLQEITAIMGEEFAKMQDEGIDVESLLATPEGQEELWHRLEEIFRTTARGMSILALPAASVQYVSGSSQVSQAQQTTQLFEALSHNAVDSKLIERLPEEAQKFVKKVTEDGDVTTVYIDHEKFNDYLNKRGIDPDSEEAKTFFQDLGIEGQLEELAVTGGDVAIPIEKYTTNIANTDHHPDLAPHIRVNQDHWSASESENWVKNNPDYTANIEAIEKEAERIRNLSNTERENNIVFKEVFDQLVSQGTSREDSTAQAAMYSAVFEVLGKEGNLNAAELFKRYGLDIQRVFDGENKVKPKPEIIDVVEEVLEAKKPTPKEPVYVEPKTIEDVPPGTKIHVFGHNWTVESITEGTKRAPEPKIRLRKKGYENSTDPMAGTMWTQFPLFIKQAKRAKTKTDPTSHAGWEGATLGWRPPKVVPGKQVATRAKKLGTDDANNDNKETGGFLPYTLERIAEEDYIKDIVDIKDLIASDKSLKEYIESRPRIRDFDKGTRMPIIVDSKGEVIDGYNRILQALEDDIADIEVFKGIPEGGIDTTEFDAVEEETKQEKVTAPKLNKLKKTELVKMAADLGIDVEENATKAILIDRINAAQSGEKQAPIAPVKPKVNKKIPVVSYLIGKGGLAPDSALAGDLKSQDIKIPGLYRKAITEAGAANQGYDNIPVEDFRAATGINPEEADGYVDVDWLYQRIVDEFAGNATLAEEDQAAMDVYERDLAAYEEELSNFEKTTEDVNVELEDARREDVESLQYDMTEMTDFLENTLGIDLDNSTPEEIEALIQEQLYDPQGRILDQAAFHGTSLGEVFDQFSTDFIGTGEGAMAFGWGLYFASKKAVAEWYRDAQGSYDIYVDDQKIEKNHPDARLLFDLEFEDYDAGFVDKYNQGQDALENLLEQYIIWRDTVAGNVNVLEEAADKESLEPIVIKTGDGGYTEIAPETLEELEDEINSQYLDLDVAEEDVKALDKYQSKKIEQKFTGKVYQVDLKPAEEDYLIWDLRLNDQSNKVKGVINDLIKEHNLGKSGGFFHGSDVYKHIGYNTDLTGTKNRDIPKRTSQELLRRGIRGIKFADGNTRQSMYEGGEVDWNYVIFDEADVEITQTFNQEAKPNEFVIWGVPEGQQDEQVLYTKAKSKEQAESVLKILEDKHGVTKARIQVIDFSKPVEEDFKELFQSAVEPQGLREGEVMHYHSSPNIFDQFEINKNRLGGTYPAGIYHHGTKARTTGGQYGDNTYRIAVELGKVGTYFPYTPKDVNQAMEDKYFEILMENTGDRGPSHKNWVRTQARKFRETGSMQGRFTGLEKREVWIAGGYDTIKDGSDYISFHPEAVRILEVNGKQAPPMKEFFQSHPKTELTLEEFIDAKQYQGTHTAPTSGYGAPGHDVTDGIYPEDVYGPNGNRYYGDGSAAGAQAINHMRQMKGKPDFEITVYRAAPKDAKTINPGDWVTTVKSYADEHGFRQYDEGEYTVLSKKVKASELFIEGNSIFEWGYSPTERQSEFFQTVPIMQGREKLRKYGLDERKRNKNQDVALALQSRQRKKYGFIDFNDTSKEAEAKIAGWIAAEVRYKARQIDDRNSAVGWYSVKFQTALNTLGKKYPELISESGFKNSKFPGVRALENNQNARDFFTLLVAITSDGQKVKQNFALAEALYKKFRKTGLVPEKGKFGGERNASMIANAKRINQMIDEKGFKGTRDFLLQVKTVSELNKIAAQEGLKFDSGFLVDTKLPMASVVIGSKLGTFYANLMGMDGYVTMDRWFSRTINRYRGDLLMKPTKSGLKAFRKIINQPNLTDEETILATVEPARAYARSGFTDKTEINVAANTIYKAAFGGLQDSPRNKSDRRFMQNVVTNARKRLKRTGINLTEADIQAVLWYYEKQLYGELGAVASAEISFEEAADILVNNKKVVPGVNVESPGGQQTEIYDQDRGLKRGSIQFRNVGRRDQKTIISLFSSADNSTFLHESGHLFLQVMQDVAESAEASDAIKADWQATLNYLGVKSGEDIGVKEHEKWAESFEQYLFEGQAPTIEMQGPFRKFKAWLQSVYKQATGLGIEINDDIRGVFDRLLGTKDEIRLAQEQNEIMALFDSPEVMGFDDKKWQEYLEAVRMANQEAEDDLDQKKLREVTRQNSKAYQREIKAMEEEVTKEAEAMPIYRAIHYLQNGEDITTKEPLENFPSLKMNTGALKETFGPGILGKLPRRRKMHSKDGTHHEDVAAIFGFESGLDMITQMQSAQPIKQFIKAQAAERVARDSGALSMNPQKLTEEAVKSIAGSKARGHLLKLQMDMTAKKAKIPGTPINVLKESARILIASKKVSSIHLKQARLAENRAYKAAQKAILEENWFEANKQVVTQTLNYFIYREAEAALDKVDKSLTYLDRISKPKHAKKLDRDAIEAIYALLDKVDLRRTRGTFKQTVAQHIENLKAEGIELPTAAEIQALMESKKTHWKDMTFGEFEVFVDSVKSIETVARYKQKIIDQNEKIEFKELVEELVSIARKENPEHLSEKTNNWKIQDPDFVPSKLKDYFKGQGAYLATHDKMEFVFEMMDGDNINGLWWNTFFRRLADAEARETEMTEQFITRLTEMFEANHTVSERRNWAKTVQTKKGKFNKENIISMALNWGNEQNRLALLAGFDKTQAEWGITTQDIEAMLNQHMEAKDWELVQQVWDLINELWPDIAALQKRVTGLVPPKVEAASFETRFGTIRGGYYPLSYDRDFNFIRDMGSTLFYESSENKNLYDKPSYARAATKQGHVETRVKESGRLVRMDLGVLSEHMNNVIHDITHREAIFYMNRLMGNEDIKEAIAGVGGKNVLSLIDPWIKRVANPRPPPYDPLEKVLNYANTSATMVAMGFKVTTALVQFFGYSQSVVYLGKGWAWQGLSSFYKNPIEAKKAIFERSSMMRTRTKSLDRDVREAIGSITAKDSRLKKVKSKYFYFIGMMDMYVSLPTWTGAYEKAIHEGMSEKDAIAQGDSAVRMTQSSGMLKDLAHVQGREDTLFKMFTKFYSYFSAYWNMSRRTARLRRKGKISQLEAFEQFLWLSVLPATLAEALLGRGPNRDDDDDNDNLMGWSTWSLMEALTFRFNGMVLIRDIKSAIMNPQFGMGTPWQDLFEYGVRIPGSMMDIMTGEDNATDWKNMLLAISYIAQLPGRQAANMYDHLVEIFDEGEDFNLYEFMVSVNRND